MSSPPRVERVKQALLRLCTPEQRGRVCFKPLVARRHSWLLSVEGLDGVDVTALARAVRPATARAVRGASRVDVYVPKGGGAAQTARRVACVALYVVGLAAGVTYVGVVAGRA
jgi:hypothetical protein